MKNGSSRREFVKAAVAASLAGVVPAAQSAENPPAAAQTDHAAPAHEQEQEQSARDAEIRFPRVFTGRNLARISCPLGGIGTGGIGLGGRGNLQDWQIFNRPDYENALEYAFPSLWVQAGSAAPYSVVLERRLLPPYDLHEEGLGFQNVTGLPRLAEARFFASFPLSRIEFEDRECPVSVVLEAFSPFQPLDADASGLPCAILTYSIHNPGNAPAEVAVAWSMSNPVGNSASRKNEAHTGHGLDGLLMTDPKMAADDPMQGSFALATLTQDGASAEVLPGWWGHQVWRVGPQHFWFDEFAKSGHLGTVQEPYSPVGSASIRQPIPAGATRSFRFLLAWHFPNRTPERCGWDAPKGKSNELIGNYYCTRFKDAWAVAEHVAANIGDLERGTRAFVDAMERSTLPGAVKDAATANLSTLVSNTSFRIADGSFHGFEGCGDQHGLGFGTCTHVWNYEMATQFLFPSLARSMRETNFGYPTDAEGHMDFRHKLPLGYEHWGAAAADGQMGQIVKLYYDWALCGDDEWLRRQWPAAKRALTYAWRPGGWDERKSGVMDGVQHNTNDVEFFGPNSMCSTWYLAALRAAARMADAMGDKDLAADCSRMADQGSKWIDANLFNGEFYVQKIRGIPADKIASGLRAGMGAHDSMDPQFQLGDGCFIDQLIGQNMATVAGLGDLLDAEHMRKALRSVHHYNYKRSLVHHASVQRTYALNDEAAVIIMDFSKGTRPEVPMPYYAEAWTGLEYSISALMMAYGMVDEALEYIENARRRFDGEKANPFDETEYGRHYARAMASWGAIPVLSGFHYDGRARRMELAPRVGGNRFKCFWSAPSAWGSFDVTSEQLTLTPLAGAIALNQLLIGPPFSGNQGKVVVTCAGKEVGHSATPQKNGVLLQFDTAVTVEPDKPLHVKA